MNLRAVARDVLEGVGIKPSWRRRLMPYRPPNVSRSLWNDEFRAGRWAGLKGLSEQPRYGVISSYIRHLKPGGSVLDVGCGEGLLVEHLSPYAHYCGIDKSDEAVHLAARYEDAKTSFAQADATDYTPAERFDVIIFNECMYYFENPVNVMRRYEAALYDHGIFIISMYLSGPDQRVWPMLKAGYAEISSTVITNPERKVTWTVKILSPRA